METQNLREKSNIQTLGLELLVSAFEILIYSFQVFVIMALGEISPTWTIGWWSAICPLLLPICIFHQYSRSYESGLSRLLSQSHSLIHRLPIPTAKLVLPQGWLAITFFKLKNNPLVSRVVMEVTTITFVHFSAC